MSEAAKNDELVIKGTKIYRLNCDAKTRIVVNQGGTGSSKTISILQSLIKKCYTEDNKVIGIGRKTLPALKQTAMKDFFSLLRQYELYDERRHNKTENLYKLNTSEVAFVSTDEPQKFRGRKWNYFHANEANEFTKEDIFQILIRLSLPTTDNHPNQLFADFNPSDEFHFIYDEIIPRPDCTFIQSSYLDNPFLPIETVREIERLKELDPNKWKIYGLGERGAKEELIFGQLEERETPESYDELFYGVDFGFNHPSTMMAVRMKDGEGYIREMIYERGLTDEEFRARAKTFYNGELVYADSAEPARIAAWEQDGFLVRPAPKGKDSVREGIDYMKSIKLYSHKENINFNKEMKSYSWAKDKNGNLSKEPIAIHDDAICVAEGSLITVKDGAKAIEDICIGDEVLTRNGYKKVLKVWNNGYNEIFAYRIVTDIFDVELQCTSNHKVYSNESWKQISHLARGETVSLCNTLMEENLLNTRGEGTTLADRYICTDTYGKCAKEKYQKDSTFITRMETRMSMVLKTWNYFQGANILRIMAKSVPPMIRCGLKNLWHRNTQKRQMKKDKSIMKVRQEGRITKDVGTQFGLKLSRRNPFVNVAEQNLNTEILRSQSFAATNASHNGGEMPDLTTSNNFASDVETSLYQTSMPKSFSVEKAVVLNIHGNGAGKKQVYDLTVEDEHEYFANGLLVHNCATRYGLYSHAKLNGGTASFTEIMREHKLNSIFE